MAKRHRSINTVAISENTTDTVAGTIITMSVGSCVSKCTVAIVLSISTVTRLSFTTVIVVINRSTILEKHVSSECLVCGTSTIVFYPTRVTPLNPTLATTSRLPIHHVATTLVCHKSVTSYIFSWLIEVVSVVLIIPYSISVAF